MRHHDALLPNFPEVNAHIEESEGRLGAYVLGATLGLGSSAAVRSARDTDTGETVAVKVVDKTKVSRYRTARRLHNELKLTALVESPNVARLPEAARARCGFLDAHRATFAPSDFEQRGKRRCTRPRGSIWCWSTAARTCLGACRGGRSRTGKARRT